MVDCQNKILRVTLGRKSPTTAKAGGLQKTPLPELAETGYARIIAKNSVTKTSSKVGIVESLLVGLVAVVLVFGGGVGVGSDFPEPGISPAIAEVHKTRPRTIARVNCLIRIS
jgi:hypothetical protein